MAWLESIPMWAFGLAIIALLISLRGLLIQIRDTLAQMDLRESNRALRRGETESGEPMNDKQLDAAMRSGSFWG